MRVNFFAKSSLASLLPLPVHDDNFPPDMRTRAFLNYRWRPFIIAQIELYLEQNKYLLSESDYDTLNARYLDFLVDLYT